MANEGIAAALQALSTIATTAADIHKNTLIVEENVLDRRFKVKEAEKTREHQLSLQTSAHENNVILEAIRFNNEVLYEYPGLETEWSDKLQMDVPTKDALQTYDWSRSKAVQTGLMTSTIDNLNKAGVHVDKSDTDDTLSQKWLSYNLGKSYASGLFGTTLSADVSFLMGGDVSPTSYTQEDVRDFEGFLNANMDLKGNYGPLAVLELQKMGLIPAAVEIKYDANNVPFIDSQDQVLINTVIQGIKAGTTLNLNFMSAEKYHAWLQANREQNIGFAATIAGSPHANKMISELGKVSAVMERELGFQTDAKTGLVITMTWDGKATEFGAILDQVDESRLPPERIKKLKVVINNLKGVSAASGVETLALYLDGLNEKDFKLLQGDISALGGGYIGNQLTTALDRYRKVNQVVALTNKYIEDPISVDKAKGMRKDMEGLGIYTGLQEIRALEIQGIDPGDPAYKTLTDRMMTRITQVSGKYQAEVGEKKIALQNATSAAAKEKAQKELDDAERRIAEFNEWILLERSVSELSKLSLTQ